MRKPMILAARISILAVVCCLPVFAANRTKQVSPVPGDPIASGMKLQDALATVTGTASDPWLVKLDPGV